MFTRNVALTFAAEMLALVANFLIGVLLARGLSVADRRVMTLVMSFPFLVASFANLGPPQASIYLIGGRGQPPQRVLGAALALWGTLYEWPPIPFWKHLSCAGRLNWCWKMMPTARTRIF